MLRYLQDCLLARLQRGCSHEGHMVAADILEGCVDGLEVKYCRRCGGVQTDWQPGNPERRFIALEHTMRRPDPHLWRDVPFGIARWLPRWAH